ncbi:MAG: hypothetical protein JNG89_12240 [Planctomycetaceae bacterium]|nr:hypothetical protein [Planctomycetaceae bacterium]
MPTPEESTLEAEERHHSYVSSVIPWYVRGIWLLFWVFVIYYGITYFLPAIQSELLNAP